MLFASTAVMAESVRSELKKGTQYYENEEYDKAAESFEKEVNLKPDDPTAHYNRANALYNFGKYDEAQQGYLQAVSFGRDTFEARSIYNAGNAKFKASESKEKTDTQVAVKGYKEALEYYKRVMEVEPEDIDAKYNYEFTLKKINELNKQQEKEQQEQQENKQDKNDQDQKDQQGKDQDKEQNKDQQQNQNQEQEQKEDNEEKEENQQNQKQDQDEQEQEQQESEQDQQQQDQDEKQNEPQPQTSEEPSSRQKVPGMTEEQAEMLLRAQEEEENRLRAEQRKARKGRRPQVLRDW